ncbi:serine/threonine-protein kinase EDR1 [Ricinus communis]|uniref:non-specific serine/threonine protein kinase n=1 Tax=Ricinus communis TaxID=3988 RepID=B9RRS8_RICCO|nr:serine/threonine-protein kinase EDR1 [Ricinus communis]EEF45788.1 map3k delta-1 protein kinase, putative [Ricinus communis]|eukprot:XP_002516447.1 serine/threonine-protein kinase EDR1 [Ricinus communis]
MSKMKHLLRKLHIGGGINDHQRLAETTAATTATRPVVNPSAAASSSIAAVESSSSSSSPPLAVVDGSSISSSGGGAADFSLLEEEFQVQLALAISVSDPDMRTDPESAQIDAAKRISLGCPVSSVSVSDAVNQSLSLRYWSYNVVNYNDKVMDGFYDVYCISSNSVIQGKMPLLVDLQAISILDNVDYEVVLVNRFMDPELRELERKAYIMSLEQRVSDGLPLNGLIQKLADLVVDRMGGPVGDADEISTRWTKRSYELRNALNSIVIPLGRLDVGLSRHRALLFKVLADRINLPCMLVKGSYYTGTDDGAVNLIRIDNESEYIIDLMGAPGTLIPAELPSSHLLNTGFDARGFADLTETAKRSSLLLGEESRDIAVSPHLNRVYHLGASRTEEDLFLGIKTNEAHTSLVEKNQIETFEQEFAKFFPSSHKPHHNSLGTGRPSLAENIKVKNVSKYVISAAKDPEFAQKLHAVLLESGASPPPDLFSDTNQQVMGEGKALEQIYLKNGVNPGDGRYCHLGKSLARHMQSHESLTTEDALNNGRCNAEQGWTADRTAKQQREMEVEFLKSKAFLSSDASSDGPLLVENRIKQELQIGAIGADTIHNDPLVMVGRPMHGNQIHEPSLPSAVDSCQLQSEDALDCDDDNRCFQEKLGRNFNMETGKESAMKLIGTSNSALHISCNGYSEKIHPMLGEVAEWEIPWEDLQIGERIGIGSYGEVYHADWNGTEVAVKKFLDQDLSGDALVQFKCEAEIMLRLRHPNVVLFMGAVTRPPHLSILTEFLPRGSLYRLLHRPNPQIDEKRRMRMALDVAKGMNYLHTSHPPIVHRDLKSPNLLVDKNWVVKVCDFGLSRLKHHTFLSSKSTAGTPEWMAPEVLRNEPANEKCDVYSFGMILWELATCQIPWKGLNPMQVVGAVGFQNKRLEIPEDVDPAIAEIINDCWQREPDLRPSFSQLISQLRHIQRLRVERS